ncbi:hypothetical protein [Sagittula sp.]|uniref:hypothetical protein n=1 Tax=Sagittula sp. TaxID=2038081 RepID=UPI003512D2EF
MTLTLRVSHSAPVFRTFDAALARAFYIDRLEFDCRASTASTLARRSMPSSVCALFTCT